MLISAPALVLIGSKAYALVVAIHALQYLFVIPFTRLFHFDFL